MSKWISVYLQLPIQLSGNICLYESMDIIVTDGANVACGEFVTGCYKKSSGNEVWHEFKCDSFIVTHWMPLPSPPESEQ